MTEEVTVMAGRHERFDEDWEERIKGILAIDNHIERHHAFAYIHDAEEVEEISYLMSFEELFDMTEWTFQQNEFIDPPFTTRQIPIWPRRKGGWKTISLGWFTIGVAFIFLVALLSGAGAATTVCLGSTMIFTMLASAITLAQYKFRKPGECHHCGTTLKHRSPIKVMNLRSMEERQHTKAGQCDKCKWEVERADLWLTALHKRIDLIYQRRYKIAWGRWKDPITGEIYSWADRNMPKDRDLTYQLNKLDQQVEDLRVTIKKMKKRKRRFRLG